MEKDGEQADDTLAKIRKQVEYYFSDKNLENDPFFHNKISADKEGWVDLDFIMNCNKIKDLTKDTEEVIKALEASTEIETDKGGIRRKDNKPLPKLNLKHKKEHSKRDNEEEKDPNAISDRDFTDPKIIEFTTELKGEEKPSWRDLEKDVIEAYPTLKFLYCRMDETVGQLAISKSKTDQEAYDKLLGATITSAGFDYTFKEPSEDDLKQFWEKHGSHYEFIKKQKLRRSKKRKHEGNDGDKSQKKRKLEETEKQYTIAGTTYANINKVKSKAKSIMNVKEDGQKLEGYEEEFMAEIIKHHPKHEQKMTNFSHFIVDEHPEYANTRCFFVVKKDGTKEDFSMSKCIEILKDAS